MNHVATITEPQLVDAAVAAIQLRHPEWQPREGNTELVLLEALAVIAGQTSFATRQMQTNVLGSLLDLYGVPRRPAASAVGQIKIEGATSMAAARTLPGGTRVRIRFGDGTSADLTTDGDLTVDPNTTTTGYVDVTAVDPGTRLNGTPIGTSVELVDPATWVETLEISQALSGGANVEPVVDWHTRGAAALRRQRSALVLPDHFADAALAVPGVGRANTINLWDAATPATAGSDLGHITVVLTDTAGQAVDNALANHVIAVLTAQALAGLTLHHADPAYRDGTLTWSVAADSDVDPQELKTSIEQAVTARLDPAVWGFGAEPNIFGLAAMIGTIPGVTAVTGCSWAWDTAAVTPAGRQLIGTVAFADETVTQP